MLLLFFACCINKGILAHTVAPIVSGNCNVWYTLMISVSVCKWYVYNFKQNLHNVPACGTISVDRCGLDKTSKWEGPKSKWQWEMRKKSKTLRKRKTRNDDDEKREGGVEDLVMRGRPRKPIANSPSTATLPPPPTHSFKLYLLTLSLLLSSSYSPSLTSPFLWDWSWQYSCNPYAPLPVYRLHPLTPSNSTFSLSYSYSPSPTLLLLISYSYTLSLILNSFYKC